MNADKYLLASSSRSFISNSLVGGNFGKLDGSQGSGCVVKNCIKKAILDTVKTLEFSRTCY